MPALMPLWKMWSYKFIWWESWNQGLFLALPTGFHYGCKRWFGKVLVAAEKITGTHCWGVISCQHHKQDFKQNRFLKKAKHLDPKQITADVLVLGKIPKNDKWSMSMPLKQHWTSWTNKTFHLNPKELQLFEADRSRFHCRFYRLFSKILSHYSGLTAVRTKPSLRRRTSMNGRVSLKCQRQFSVLSVLRKQQQRRYQAPLSHVEGFVKGQQQRHLKGNSCSHVSTETK